MSCCLQPLSEVFEDEMLALENEEQNVRCYHQRQDGATTKCQHLSPEHFIDQK